MAPCVARRGAPRSDSGDPAGWTILSTLTSQRFREVPPHPVEQFILPGPAMVPAMPLKWLGSLMRARFIAWARPLLSNGRPSRRTMGVWVGG